MLIKVPIAGRCACRTGTCMVIVGNWYIGLDGKSMLGGRNGAHAGTKFIHLFLHSLNSVEHLTDSCHSLV